MKNIESLISKIKDPEKANELMRKLSLLKNSKKKASNTKGRGGNQMVDKFDYNLKGHISIDQIDKKGNVIGNLVDKDNLVVDKAEEIVLRSLSGDSKRMIYKNRKPKGGSQEVLVPIHKLGGKKIIENGIIPHDVSLLWEEADDEMFDVELAYYPTTLWIEETSTKEAGMKAFT